MRTNLPVSTTEYPFPQGKTLVSTTDTKGRILYCNTSFIEVSGYEKEELLGQPHNLIRHPDMPEEAFRDMWETISSGRPWSAPVKNRRKNGDYYWVMANATPLLENGKPIGYMSVRTEATREQVAAAERLYAQMRAEKASGRKILSFKAGRLVKHSLAGWTVEALRPSLSVKVLLVQLLLTTLTGLLAISVTQQAGVSSWTAGAVIAANALFTVGAWQWMCGLTVRPLGSLVQAANRMAGGDMTGKVTRTRNDEIGDLQTAFAQLSVNLRSIVRDARDQSMEMAHATGEIAQGNLDLSQRTEAQASNLEQTAASMEEITGTVRQSAESADQVKALSTEVVSTAEQGRVAVDQVGETMNAINTASKRIGEITQVIDGIAFQTNILALNAAVEAARAGEQGRGFAVVAGEVRSLAQRSLTAAREIKVLIDDSARAVEMGRQKTEAARQTMAEAVHGVRQVNTLIDEISSAAREQLSGISQINAAVAQMDTITQQNAALVEQIAASAHALEDQAQNTTETVKVFRIDGARAPEANAVNLRRQARAMPRLQMA